MPPRRAYNTVSKKDRMVSERDTTVSGGDTTVTDRDTHDIEDPREETIPMNTSVDVVVDVDVDVDEVVVSRKTRCCKHGTHCAVASILTYFLMLILLVIYSMYVNYTADDDAITRDTPDAETRLQEHPEKALIRMTPKMNMYHLKNIHDNDVIKKHSVPLASLATSAGCPRCFRADDPRVQTHPSSEDDDNSALDAIYRFLLMWLCMFIIWQMLCNRARY
jgi:hypothetical protein